MEVRIGRRKPRARRHTGDAILANAQALNMKPVKSWFDAFADVHRSYVEAQQKVETVEQALAQEQARTLQLDADQDDAVEALALCLVNDGEPRTRPFARFGHQAPGTMKSLAMEEEARAIHALVATLQRHKSLSPATLAAANNAEEAARKLEAGLPPLEVRRQEVKAARGFRDTIGQKWDTQLAALRLAVRGAAATTVPGLYTALFGRSGRSTKKVKGTLEPAATPIPAVADTPSNPPATPPA